MYQYNSFDKQFVAERVSQYRDQTQRYLAGELSEDEFLQLRLRNGLYIQRLAPMLRVAVPYGTPLFNGENIDSQHAFGVLANRCFGAMPIVSASPAPPSIAV